MGEALAIVIGRAGSRGLPGKNALRLAGRPMVCHTLDEALAARSVGRVVVSTDCPSVADAAGVAGVRVVDRPASLATDAAPVSAAVQHAVRALEAREPVIVVLYANVPVRPPGLIDLAVRTLLQTGADSVQSYTDVGKCHPLWMVRLDDGRVQPHAPGSIDRRQDLPKLLIPDGGVIAVTRACLLGAAPDPPHAFLGRDRRGIETPAGSVVDVDSAADLVRAEAALAAAATGAVA